MEIFGDYMILVIVGICYCIGFIIKNYIPTDKVNKFIPVIMGILGVFLNVWLNDWAINPEIILGGLASGLATTGLNEAGKHIGEMFNNGGDEDD